MKIFVINLDRSPKRLSYMEEQLNGFGLPFERIRATDGKELDMDNLDQFAVRSQVEAWKDLLTPNAIACSMSHHSVYNKMIEQGTDMALVLEDDIELNDDFPELLKCIEKNGLNDTDIFLLYFHGEKKKFSRKDRIEISSKYSFYPAVSVWGAYSTGGYILKNAVAHKLSEHVFPVRTTADSWGTFHRDGIIGGLWALLPLATKSANFGSEIGYSKMSRAMKAIESLSIPFIDLLLMKVRKLLHKVDSDYEIVDIHPDWKNNNQ